MAETETRVPLDGTWRVERLSGVLPPLPIRKRITGDSGVTRIGLVRLPFRVEGMTLRYRPPLHAFADELQPNRRRFRRARDRPRTRVCPVSSRPGLALHSKAAARA
jgi:hypothetical protein